MFARYRKSPPSSGQLNNNNSPNPKGGSQHAKFNTTNNDAISTAIQANNKDQAEKIRIESAAAAAASLEELRTKLDRLEYLTDKIAPKPPPPPQPDKKDAPKGKISTDAIAAGTMRSSMLLTEDLMPSDSTAAAPKDDSNMDKFSEKYPMDNEKAKDNIKIAMKEPPQEEEKVKRSPSAQAADLLANSNAYFLSVSYEDEVEIVELLRRIAELVVLSERRAGQLLAEVVSTGESMDELDEVEEHVGEGSGENDDSRTVQSKGESTGESPAADKSTQSLPPPAPEALLSSKKSKAAEKRKQKQQYNEDRAFPYLAIFELFCERNGLANIVNIVTGVAFQQNQVEEIAASQDDEGVAPIKGKSTKIQDVVLPPLSIATQAVQSISILIQNVSRATSLYFLLSNNRVNDLIKLPLHLYSRAEMNALNDAKKSPRKSIRGRNKQQQQEMNSEMSELSTHFVSFLKSLAMRVNAETLQFFLSFPLNENCTKEESTTTADVDDPNKLLNSYLERRKVVEFPLYSRALEFCSQDHDSFVRVTAMNVCMNIIRLVTINSNEDIMNDGQMQGDDSENDSTDGKANESQHKSLPTATPSGMLHDSPTLPLQDRIAIAQYACHPTRVSDLVSPLCARLTSQFGQVEGTLRALEESSSDITNSTSPQSAKKPSKKEEDPARLRSTIQDLIANVQDELLLLDDLLKVGLISLNEQAIEMLFATFVYPMLLQPLLLPLHRFSSSKNKTEEGEESLVSKKPTITLQSPMPFSTDDNDTDVIDQDDENDNKAKAIATPQSVKGEATSDTPNSPTAPTSTPDDTNSKTHDKQTYSSCDMDLSPSKTALFGLSVIFHTVSNPTFRHLLLTALLHPQSPEASGGVVITTPPQVTLPARSKTGDSGTSKFQFEVRSERNQERQSKDSEDFQQHVNVYTFGTEPGVAKDDDVDSGSSCVFILAPALVDMLRNNTSLADGIKDMQITHPNTRPNPYRAILMSSISGSDDMVSLQSLATAALHAAVSLVDGSIVQKIMFPGSTGHLTSNNLDPCNDDVVKETLRCLCKGIVNTSVTYDGWWKIKFNTVAAKTLMDMIEDNNEYIRFVETIVGDIRIKAAEYLMTLPSLLDGKSREGNSSSITTPNKKTGDRQHLDNWLLDRFFFDQADKYTNSVVENVCYLKEHINDDSDAKEQYRYGLEVLTSISITTTSALLCEDTSVVDNMLVDTKSTPFHCAASWALASLYLDAFCVKLSKMSSAMADAEQSEEDGEAKNIPHQSLSYISATNSGDDDSTVGRALAHISSKFAIAMLDEGESSDKKTTAPIHGSAVGLVGKAAFPCVCEVSNAFSSLFTGRTCISNEGISWQSLYLVVVGKWAVLAEPGHGGTGGEGRVITACRLACLAVKKDSSALANNKTPARRLLVAHASLDPRPPSLFLVDSTTSRRGGPSLGANGLRLTRSRMDLWFEDANAANHACKVLSAKIAKARAKRGSRIGSALLTK